MTIVIRLPQIAPIPKIVKRIKNKLLSAESVGNGISPKRKLNNFFI